MTPDILSIFEKLKNGELAYAIEELSVLNSSLATLNTLVQDIVNTQIPAKVDKVGGVDGMSIPDNILSGDFWFGALSGTPQFRGIVQPGSRIRHYGDTVDNNDIVNVIFVKNQIEPIRKLAQLAIRRNGDIVSGTSLSRLTYKFAYCDIEFKSTTDVIFNGPVTVNDTFDLGVTSNGTYQGIIAASDNLVNKGYVDQRFNVSVDRAVFNATANTDPLATGVINFSAWTQSYTTNFTNYFQIGTNSLTALVDVTCVITCKLSESFGTSHGNYALGARIKINGLTLDESFENQYVNDDQNGIFACHAELPIHLNAGDIITFECANSTGGYNVYAFHHISVVTL